MKRSLNYLLVIFLLPQVIFGRWGWDSHRYINDHAIDYLPEEMAFFEDHREYLREHSIDPDTYSDPNPGYYHYIDIDYYPEFFAGTLPHTWSGILDLYNQSTVEDKGIVPWVIDWWVNDMTQYMSDGDWDNVWQVASELGHYVADSHQPLHLTMNYNGQLTDNYDIHSRYESTMINAHLDYLTLPDTTGEYWPDILDSVFAYIEDIYPTVDMVMAADSLAKNQDPDYGSIYYSILWSELEEVTVEALHRGVVDLASIWYTAWINAGSPLPAGVGIDAMPLPQQLALYPNFPNPFNPLTNIHYSLDRGNHVQVVIYDIMGRELIKLIDTYQMPGNYGIVWSGTDSFGADVGAGIYFCVLRSGEGMEIIKMTRLD